MINKYLKLIQGQSNLINKLTEENNLLMQMLQEERYRKELYISSTAKYKQMYTELINKLREIK